MILAYICAFLVPTIYAVSNILEAQFSTVIFKSSMSAVFYCGITNILSLPVFLIIGGKDTFLSDPYLLSIIFLTAVLDLLCYIPYYMSLKKLDTSVVAALFIPAQVLLPILSYLLVSEKLSVWQYIGFFITLGASLLLNLKYKAKFTINIGFYLMMLSALMFVLEQVVSKKALFDMPWYSFAFYWCIFTDLLLLSFLFVPSLRRNLKSELPAYKKHISWFLFAEVLDRSASMCYVYGLAMLPVVVRAAIGSMQPIFVLSIGFILYCIFGDRFKEDFSKAEVIKKICCFILIILGVVLSVY